MAYLVQQKIFTEVTYHAKFYANLINKFYFKIELGFLMVGHTHEDIDQSFSCLSRYLRKHDALTMPGMQPTLCLHKF